MLPTNLTAHKPTAMTIEDLKNLLMKESESFKNVTRQSTTMKGSLKSKRTGKKNDDDDDNISSDDCLENQMLF